MYIFNIYLFFILIVNSDKKCVNLLKAFIQCTLVNKATSCIPCNVYVSLLIRIFINYRKLKYQSKLQHGNISTLNIYYDVIETNAKYFHRISLYDESVGSIVYKKFSLDGRIVDITSFLRTHISITIRLSSRSFENACQTAVAAGLRHEQLVALTGFGVVSMDTLVVFC